VTAVAKGGALMDSEVGFLKQLQAEPADDATRLVYADWLEEQGDPVSAAKAGFLRVSVDQIVNPDKNRKKKRKRLQELAATLDTGWLAVVSRLAIENCYGKRAEAESGGMYVVRWDYLCDRQWEDLKPTDDRAVRFCEGCQHNVHYCDTITEAREHAWQNHCIAVDLGVIRRERDLEPELMYVGRPSTEELRQERERMEPDAVSAERERRKRGTR
jgi:uncharacterized protein (TIGR02996 family)